MAGPPKRRGAADALIAEAAKPHWQMRSWPAELREEFEERAAIMEHMGNMSREEAEGAAFEMLRGRVTPPK